MTSYRQPTSLSPSDWLGEVIQLEPGAFRAHSTMRVMNDVAIRKTRTSHASLHRLAAPSGWVSVIMSDGAMLVGGGHRLAPQECVVLHSRAQVEAVTECQSEVISVAVSGSSWSNALERLEIRATAWSPGAYLVRCEREAMFTLRSRADAALQVHPETTRAATNSAPPRRLTDDLIDQVKRVANESSSSPRTQWSRRARRQRAVALARHYIREHLADPIRLSDLCSYAHLRPRALEYGFREVLRLSPLSYLKVLRLNVVHRQLVSNSCASRSISAIALDAGFSHFGQFGVDYKRLFLESPSATRRRVADARFRTMAHSMQPPARAVQLLHCL